MAEADAGLVGLAIAAFGAVAALARRLRWRRTGDVRRSDSLRRFYEMTVSGVAVNNVLPGEVGGLSARAVARSPTPGCWPAARRSAP